VSVVASAEVMKRAFVRLLDLARRERKLTVEAFAHRADVDVAESVDLSPVAERLEAKARHRQSCEPFPIVLQAWRVDPFR
jgi:hypothetical protein